MHNATVPEVVFFSGHADENYFHSPIFSIFPNPYKRILYSFLTNESYRLMRGGLIGLCTCDIGEFQAINFKLQ
jgi:hypothetical protein